MSAEGQDGKQVFFDQPVKLEPYRPEWAQQFENEKKKLETVLEGFEGLEIEHFGSTSIPGIRLAKPIIDIAIGVGHPDHLPLSEGVMTQLLELGYLHHATPDIPASEYMRFNKGSPIVDTNIHFQVSLANSQSLRMRDYLRAHPDAARRYAEAKRDVISRGPVTMLEYRSGKGAILSQLAAEAQEWDKQGRPV